jgi:ubiquinone/menaquinone biosynthesis C-methylase UbiE
MRTKNKIKNTIKKVVPRPFINFMRNYVLIRPSKRMLKNLFDLLGSPLRNRMYKIKLDKMKKNGQLSEEDVFVAFKGVSDSFWFWLFTKGQSQMPAIMPNMPEEHVQLQFTGVSGYRTLEEAFSFYQYIKMSASGKDSAINQETKILDYGCGWGRIIRFFLKETPPSNLYGIDCDEEVINVCKTSNLKCNFQVNNIFPPTEFADNFFDVIYSFSVFSHLSEDAHKRWLQEFNRILKPGGILVATTRDRDFIILCAKVREMEETEVPFFAKGLTNAFVNTTECLNDYDNGKYLYEPVGGGGIRDGSFYGETCIPPKYVLTEWKKYFRNLDFVNHKRHQSFDQNAIIAQK